MAKPSPLKEDLIVEADQDTSKEVQPELLIGEAPVTLDRSSIVAEVQQRLQLNINGDS